MSKLFPIISDSDSDNPNIDKDNLLGLEKTTKDKELNTGCCPNQEKMSETKIADNHDGSHWVIGDEDKESYDDFPQIGEETISTPPAAPSDGQGGRWQNDSVSPDVRQALLEKRRRLK